VIQHAPHADGAISKAVAQKHAAVPAAPGAHTCSMVSTMVAIWLVKGLPRLVHTDTLVCSTFCRLLMTSCCFKISGLACACPMI
jgi:hypothetical protein